MDDSSTLKLLLLSFLLSFTAFGIEHATHINPITTYEHQKFYHGVEIRAEQLQEFEDLDIYTQPAWKQYHNGAFMGSGVLGLRYKAIEPVIGLNMGYDVSSMPITTLQQMSWGIELRDEIVELHIRHYRPWPRVKKVNGYEIAAYYHTDVDFLVKDDFVHWGFGMYETNADLGVKATLRAFYQEYGTTLDWKWDRLMKHTYTLAFTWNFPVLGKKSFNNLSHFVYNEKKIVHLAARPRLSLLETPLVVQGEPPFTEIGRASCRERV